MQPERSIFLRARWEYLVMINYAVDPAILLPHMPPGTELDLFNDEAIISMVGFMFNDTSVFGLRWPWHTSFEEVNLRFYVKHFDGKKWKRGVVFISEIVPRPVIAFIANKLYREHYSARPMKHYIKVVDDNITVQYQFQHQKHWNSLGVTAETSLADIKPGSEEEFIFEHYWGYNTYKANTTVEYGVEHDVWQIHKVKDWHLSCDTRSLYGEAFVTPLAKKPSSVFLAKGSQVIIRKPLLIKVPQINLQ